MRKKDLDEIKRKIEKKKFLKTVEILIGHLSKEVLNMRYIINKLSK